MITPEQIILRLVTGAALGAAVGLERERLEWVAGLRTHMLVCLGSTLVMIVSAFGFSDILAVDHVGLDPSRIAAQVVSGIGFLGAGTILFLRQEVIRGLTTAASLWATAGVGLAVGGGLYLAAIITTVLIVAILALVKPLEKRLFRRQESKQITLLVDHLGVSLIEIQSAIEKEGLGVKQIVLKRGDSTVEDYVQFTFQRSASKETVLSIARKLQEIAGVRGVTL